MARLKDGVSPTRAQAELRVAWRGALRESTAHEMPDRFRSNLPKEELYLDPAGSGVDSWLRSHFAKPLYVLLGMSALMLFAACFNVANLLLALTQARQRELAVRFASGASRMRILQQFLTECGLLALLGLAGGILIYEWCIKGLLYFVTPAGETVILDTRPDARMLLFTLGVAVLTILLFGLLPSIRAGHTSLRGALAASTPQASAKSSWARTILTMQLAVSFVLLSGACLLARSLYDLRTFDAGFRRDHLLIAAPDAVSSYPSATDRKHFEERLVARISALPGVRSASASILIPGERFWMAEYYGEGSSGRSKADTLCSLNFVTPGYFMTFGTTLLAGRDFSKHDEQPGAPATAIVSESFANHFWGAHSALGRRIYDIDHPEPITVIGVARNSRTLQLRAAAPRNVYRVYPPPARLNWNFYIAVWTYHDPSELFGAVRSVVRQEDPRVPVELQSFDSMIGRRLLYERLLAVLALCFAACAALLAAIRAYGIASYSANRRRAEIAIRAALGATRRQLVGLFVGEHLLVSLLGLTGGLFGAWCLTGFLRSWLFGVSAGDPLTLTLSGLMLAAISTLATAVPAGIAIRREAWETLRRE